MLLCLPSKELGERGKCSFFKSRQEKKATSNCCVHLFNLFSFATALRSITYCVVFLLLLSNNCIDWYPSGLQETECSGSLVMKTSASKDLITDGHQLSDEEVLGKHKALSHTLSLKSILGKSSFLNDFLGKK